MRHLNILATLSFIFLILSFSTKENPPRHIDVVEFVDEYTKTYYPDSSNANIIFVSVRFQKLYLIRYKNVISEYDVSTSKYGIGNQKYSNKTPTGLHRIEHKIGNGVPLNGIIKAGLFTKEKATIKPFAEEDTADVISTRVLWLKGLELGKNLGGEVDSYTRRIYIHGTSEEGLIGQPSSHGCIRMKNYDVLELFELVEPKMKVLILDV